MSVVSLPWDSSKRTTESCRQDRERGDDLQEHPRAYKRSSKIREMRYGTGPGDLIECCQIWTSVSFNPLAFEKLWNVLPRMNLDQTAIQYSRKAVASSTYTGVDRCTILSTSHRHYQFLLTTYPASVMRLMALPSAIYAFELDSGSTRRLELRSYSIAQLRLGHASIVLG
jgi:hypothetical protein